MADRECVCRYCGRTFIGHRVDANVCNDPDCRRKMNTDQVRSKRESARRKKNERRMDMTAWKQIIREVEESGLSYGQYVARRGK